MSSDTSNSQPLNGRIASLDALRGVAALGVVIFHLISRVKIGDSTASFWIGAYGVELFFMISGFVIFQSIQRNGPRNFVKSRFLRLFPTFWFCVILTTIVLLSLSPNHSVSWAKFFANLTMIPKQFLGNNGYIDGSYWTLEYELYFYIFSGVLFYLFGRNVLVASLLGLVVVNLLVNLFEVIPRLNEFPRYLGSVFMRIYGFLFIEYAHLFLVGVICSRQKEYSKLVVVGICSICMIAGVLGHRHKEFTFEQDALLLLACFSLFWYCATSNPVFLRNQRALLWLGFISYPLYLVHMSIGRALCDRFMFTGFVQWCWVLSVIVLMILLASVISVYVEPWLKRLFTKGSLVATPVNDGR